jgi:DNA-binding MarR family transcriptional regulator
MTSKRHDRATQLADLAQFVLSVARDIRIYGRFDPEIMEITLLESLVMNHIERNPGTSPSRLCDEVGLRSSNASALLRSLEAKGLIRRIPDSKDRRSVSLRATPLAARNLKKVRGEWAQFLARHVNDTADVAPTIELLSALDESLTRAGVPVLARPGRDDQACGLPPTIRQFKPESTLK